MTYTPEEKQYRKTVNRLGFTMLIFLGTFMIVSGAIAVLTLLTDLMPQVVGDVVYNICYCFLYMAIFVVPAFFFRLIVPKGERAPIHTACRMPRETPLYIFAAVALTGAAAYLNAVITDLFFDYGSVTEEIVGGASLASNYQLVLMVFTTALAPAFAEELLFRGVVLGNLLPYGRTTAVLGSAFLFGLMHQNTEQFLYTMVAGLILGYMYVQTRSIWPCVLTHFCNNFLSIIYTAISERMPNVRGTALIYVVELTVLALGLVSAILLIRRGRNRKRELCLAGCFEQDVEPDPEHAEIPLPWRRRLRLFFTPPMIVFVILAVVEALAMVGLLSLMEMFPI